MISRNSDNQIDETNNITAYTTSEISSVTSGIIVDGDFTPYRTFFCIDIEDGDKEMNINFPIETFL
jgi:hypothetical protein